jgi:hypothetical protein
MGLALAWAVAALARETGAAVAGWDDRQANVRPADWRFGSAPVERLERCLAGAEGWLPSGTTVLFTSPASEPSAEFYRWRWAAYLLPDLQVGAPGSFDDPRDAPYVIAYRRTPTPPAGCRLDPIRDLDGGRIYRVFCP